MNNCKPLFAYSCIYTYESQDVWFQSTVPSKGPPLDLLVGKQVDK